MIEVTIDGGDVVIRKLQHLSNVGEALRPAMVRAADRVREYVSLYPPASEANTPRPGHTHYERGLGSVYTRKRDGGRTVRKTSQMMNRKWSTKYRFTRAEAEAVIGNSASYAPYVHDGRQQARFHKRRNWRTVQETTLKLKDVIRGDFEQAVKQWLERG